MRGSSKTVRVDILVTSPKPTRLHPSPPPAPARSSPLREVEMAVPQEPEELRVQGQHERRVPVDRLPHRLDRAHEPVELGRAGEADRKSTRLNSSHSQISYAVFC